MFSLLIQSQRRRDAVGLVDLWREVKGERKGEVEETLLRTMDREQ